MFKFKPAAVLFSLALFLLSSCTTVGLGNVAKTRENYNLALNQSDNEQFLLNIVRMHFDKSPYFVGVDSITTQTTLKMASGSDDTTLANATNGRLAPPLGAFWNFQPNIEFTQSPTITYSPLQGTSYISGLLTAIDITKFYYLVHTNLSLASVFKLSVDQIGPLCNDTEGWQNDKRISVSNQGFNSFVETIDQLRMERKAGLYRGNYKNNPVLILAMYDTASAALVAKALHLNKPYQQIILSRYETKATAGNVVKLQTRSFFGVLSFLSKGVIAAPSVDKEYGIASQITLNSQTVAIDHLTDGLFKMYSSESTPINATNKVSYEGHWYYFPNSDHILD